MAEPMQFEDRCPQEEWELSRTYLERLYMLREFTLECVEDIPIEWQQQLAERITICERAQNINTEGLDAGT